MTRPPSGEEKQDYFVIAIPLKNYSLQIPISHPEHLIEDFERARQIAAQNNMPAVAKALGVLLNDQPYLESIRPEVYKAYDAFRIGKLGGFTREELLVQQNGRWVPSAVSRRLHEEGLLSDVFLPRLWESREGQAIEIYNALNAVLPDRWLEKAREEYLPDLILQQSGLAIGPATEAELSRRRHDEPSEGRGF